MADLREALAELGEVRTYLQSGNVVLATRLQGGRLEAACERLIADKLGVEAQVLTRSAEEMQAVVANNPLKAVADNPKRYQVTFLRSELPKERVTELTGLAAGKEQLVPAGRELYVWHPDGAARSKLWNKLAAAGLGVVATSRNWTTVQTLAEWAVE